MSCPDEYYFHVGEWRFYPASLTAVNVHNGAVVEFRRQGGLESIDKWLAVYPKKAPPAQWMLDELQDWFEDWIVGGISSKTAARLLNPEARDY